jgi:predicted house-cleaning NTP pyrophosphatase (Maf/HAM1 superfamily)
MRSIHWEVVEARCTDATKVLPPRSLDQPEFKDVPSITPEEVQEMLSFGKRVQIIDTLPRHYGIRAQDIVEGAVWRDPERREEWRQVFRRTSPWSHSVYTASTSGARARQRCERPVLTLDRWLVGTTHGRPSRAR